MTARITRKDLDDLMERMNARSRAKYRLCGAYGKVGVNRLALEVGSGAVTTLLPLGTKRETYARLWAILSWQEQEQAQILYEEKALAEAKKAAEAAGFKVTVYPLSPLFIKRVDQPEPREKA